MINEIQQLNTLLQLEYQENSVLYECVGKVISDDGKTLVIGFNFYLGDAIDTVAIAKENLISVNVASL